MKEEEIKEKGMGIKGWVKTLNRIKVIAIVVVNCFLLTGVYGQAVAGVLENKRATEQFKQVFEDMDVPYSYGKITQASYKGSDKVFINIQDLHSHAEVQKNINNIISMFDDKYGVKNIYLEGAYGQVSTRWLTVGKDEKVKRAVLEKMIEAGRLTGAEYYSAKTGKTEIIKGLESKEEYFDNLKRFSLIIGNQEVIGMHIRGIKETVKGLRERYYNRQQKKIEELSKKYTEGKISAQKYFGLMSKHAQKLGIDVDRYENLGMYIRMMEKQKKINYERTTQELQMFVLKLKENIPYSVYKMLVEGTKNFTQMDKLYGYLIKLSRQYNLDLGQNFRELEKFFEYIELSQKINPLELIKEEQDFKDDINDKYSRDKAEQEVVFINNFVRYYEEYLSGKITADDCKYYKKNILKFKHEWVKYIDNREIVALEGYEKMSDEFYKINNERNGYFIDSIKGELVSKKIEAEVKGENETEKAINSMKSAKEIYITVTGGFHTEELSKLISEAGITSIVITPSVTTDTKEAEETYYKIAQEQAKIAFQAIATLIKSNYGSTAKLLEFFKYASKAKIDTTKLKEIAKEVSKEINKERKKAGQENIEIEVKAENIITINEETYKYENGGVIKEGIKRAKGDGNKLEIGRDKIALNKSIESDSNKQGLKGKIEAKIKELGYEDIEVKFKEEKNIEGKEEVIKIENNSNDKRVIEIDYGIIQKYFMKGTEIKGGILIDSVLTTIIGHKLKQQEHQNWNSFSISVFDIKIFIEAMSKEVIKKISREIGVDKDEVIYLLYEALIGKREEYKNKIIGLLQNASIDEVIKICLDILFTNKEIKYKIGNSDIGSSTNNLPKSVGSINKTKKFSVIHLILFSILTITFIPIYIFIPTKFVIAITLAEFVVEYVMHGTGFELFTFIMLPFTILSLFDVITLSLFVVLEVVLGVSAIFSLLSLIFKNRQINFLKKAVNLEQHKDDEKINKYLKIYIDYQFKKLGFKDEEIGDASFVKGEFAHVDDEGVLHINYVLIQKLFMNGTKFKQGIIINAYFKTWIKHELMHKKHHSWGERIIVVFDFFTFIWECIKGIWVKITGKEDNYEEEIESVSEMIKKDTGEQVEGKQLEEAMKGSTKEYKNKVITLLKILYFSSSKVSIVNCAAKSLAKVLKGQLTVEQIALQLLLKEISLGLFKRERINGSQIETSMLAMQKVMNEELEKQSSNLTARGYSVVIDTFIEAMKVEESAIVWVNKNHYIVVTKIAKDKYVIRDSNINNGKSVKYSVKELKGLLKGLLKGEKVKKTIGNNEEQVRYQAQDETWKIKILTTSKGLQEEAKKQENQSTKTITILTENEMRQIFGANITGAKGARRFDILTSIYGIEETGIDIDRYKRICAIPVRFVKGKDGEIIRGEGGRDIFKASAYYDSENNRIVFRFIGTSKEAIEKLIKEQGEEVYEQINKVLRGLLIDRLAIDSVVMEELDRIIAKDKGVVGIEIGKKDIAEVREELKEIGYKDEEIEELLTTAVKANTYVDLKDAEVVISKNTKLEEVITVNKMAGVSKVVLVKGKGIKEITEGQIEQIRMAGLEVVIGIDNRTTKKEIERYNGMKGVSGFRVLKENKEITNEYIKGIMEEGKEISYKVGKKNIGKIGDIEKELKGKVVYVIEAEAIEEIRSKGNIEEIKRLAKEEGRISIYFKTDREEIKRAKEIIEEIYGKGVEAAKTMISVGAAHIENSFGKLFNKEGASRSFSEGYEIGYEGIYGEEGTIGYVAPEHLIREMKGIITGKMSYEEFDGKLEGIKEKGILTERLELKIKDILEDKGTEGKEKMAMLRQYITGSIVSYIEDNMDKIYEKEIDINRMKMEVKKQIVYRILQALVRGKSIEQIREEIEEAQKRIEGKEGTLAELVRRVLGSKEAEEIKKQWNKTDMVIEGIADFEAIRILLDDNIKPVREIAKMTVDVIKGVRATLSAA